MRLNKEDYNRAVGILKRYNYNCINIISINNDIVSIGAANYNGSTASKNSIVDTTLNKVIQLEENKELRGSIKEYKIVQKTLLLVSNDAKKVFEEEFEKQKNKWEVINILNFSEETYKRRKRELIYTVNNELKKLT